MISVVVALPMISIAAAATSKPTGPSYFACAPHSAGASLPFCNTSLSIDERVDDFIGRLSLEEKVALIGPDPSLGSTCNDHTAGVARLGVPQWMWLVETNTGDNSACYAQDRCASTFPGPMAMGASFNRSSWRLKGSVLGSELRAFNNLGWHRDAGVAAKAFIGLTGFGPNINIARDPRFGRSSELPGEDPTLSGVYATEMVQGMQEEDAHGYPKMLAFLKHFTAYSTETNRGHDDYTISQHDLFETYLPQYEMAFTKGGASGAMCSYNAVNGHPSCANSFVLKTLLKESWSPHEPAGHAACGQAALGRVPWRRWQPAGCTLRRAAAPAYPVAPLRPPPPPRHRPTITRPEG